MEKNVSVAERLEKEKQAKKNKQQKGVKMEGEGNSDCEEVVAASENETRPCEPLDYEGADEKYGIVFCDTDMVRVSIIIIFFGVNS